MLENRFEIVHKQNEVQHDHDQKRNVDSQNAVEVDQKRIKLNWGSARNSF